MRIRVFVGGAGFLLTAGVLCFAWSEARARAAVERFIAELERHQAIARTALQAAGSRLAAAELRQSAREAARTARRETARSALETLDPARAAAMERIARFPWRDAVLEKNPALQARYFATRRSELRARYGDFVAAARLTEAQTERLFAILNEARAREMDLNATMRDQALAESDPALLKLRADADAKTRAAELELLGEADYARLGEYERMLPIREFVDNLAGNLVFLDATLTPEQADGLTQIMAEASEDYRQSGKSGVFGPGPIIDVAMRTRQPARENFDAAQALALARTILTPAQYAAFEMDVQRSQLVIRVFNSIRQTPDAEIVGFVFGRR